MIEEETEVSIFDLVFYVSNHVFGGLVDLKHLHGQLVLQLVEVLLIFVNLFCAVPVEGLVNLLQDRAVSQVLLGDILNNFSAWRLFSEFALH